MILLHPLSLVEVKYCSHFVTLSPPRVLPLFSCIPNIYTQTDRWLQYQGTEGIFMSIISWLNDQSVEVTSEVGMCDGGGRGQGTMGRGALPTPNTAPLHCRGNIVTHTHTNEAVHQLHQRCWAQRSVPLTKGH